MSNEVYQNNEHEVKHAHVWDESNENALQNQQTSVNDAINTFIPPEPSKEVELKASASFGKASFSSYGYYKPKLPKFPEPELSTIPMSQINNSAWDVDETTIAPVQTNQANMLTPLEPVKEANLRQSDSLRTHRLNATGYPRQKNTENESSNIFETLKKIDKKTLAIIGGTGAFVVVSATVLITCVVLYTIRASTTSKANYLESCISKACLESKYLTCMNQTCQCDPSHYKWDATTLTCLESTSNGGATHGSYCVSGVTACATSTSCIESICKCDSSTQYWDGSACNTKKTYQSSCTVRTKANTTCLSDAECFECSNSSNLICNSTTLMCDCAYGYYYDVNSMKCVGANTYYQYCNSSIPCDSTKGLTCKTIDTNVTDNCPTLINQCDCMSGYYFDFTTQKCQRKKPYLRSCSTSCECDDSDGLQCYNGLCLCRVNSYYNSTTCISVTPALQLKFYDMCTVTNQCNTQIGLFCNLTLGYCSCPYPYYWSSISGSCVECPDGWVMINLTANVTRCYYFSTTNVAFSDAWARCVNSEAQLLLIEDSNEWTVLTNYMVPFGVFYHWIGLYYDSYNGGYFWWNGLQTGTWGYYPGNGCGNPSSYQYFTWYLGSGTSYLCNWYRTYPTRFICKKNF